MADVLGDKFSFVKPCLQCVPIACYSTLKAHFCKQFLSCQPQSGLNVKPASNRARHHLWRSYVSNLSLFKKVWIDRLIPDIPNFPPDALEQTTLDLAESRDCNKTCRQKPLSTRSSVVRQACLRRRSRSARRLIRLKYYFD